MAEDIDVAVISPEPEVYGLGPVPPILDRLDEEHGVAQPEFDRPFVGFVAGITFDAQFHGCSVNNEASYVLGSPIGRVVPDPEFAYLAVDVVNNPAARLGAAHSRLPAGFIHGFHIHATLAFP